MKYLTSILALLILNFISMDVAAGADPGCVSSEGSTLQILGSGGPIADDGRASTSYLLWINGRAHFMIDSGGGSFLRFGEAGARFEDLKHIGISHLHTDHSTDLVALLKSGYFSNRDSSLSISGPAGGNVYPGMSEYLARLLDSDGGAYSYLAGYLDGSAGLIRLVPIDVDPKHPSASLVYADPGNDIDIHALGVPHGPVPALAYRIRVGKQSIVFAGDQNGSSDAFIKFASGTDVLLMHMPVGEDVSGVGRKLHAPPSIIGNIADQSDAKKLVLSHFMARSLHDLEENLEEIRAEYAGPMVSVRDLDCVGF